MRSIFKYTTEVKTAELLKITASQMIQKNTYNTVAAIELSCISKVQSEIFIKICS